MPGGVQGTYQRVVLGYLNNYATLMTAENVMNSNSAPDARVYDLETMELIASIRTPQEAIDACDSI